MLKRQVGKHDDASLEHLEAHLTLHEMRLLQDYQARSKGMSALNLATGVAGSVAALLLASQGLVAVALAILAGSLIGVSLEKRYLNEMSGVIQKLIERAPR